MKFFQVYKKYSHMWNQNQQQVCNSNNKIARIYIFYNSQHKNIIKFKDTII